MNEIVLPAPSRAPKYVLFLFHGFGKNKENLSSLGKELLKARSDVEIHIPDGIEECEEGSGLQWFDLIGENVSVWEEDFLKKAPQIISYIDEVLATKEMNYRNVILAGFSQGAMVALSLGLRLGVSGVIAFSGLMLDGKCCVGKIHTKVLLLHGAVDNVIPVDAMKLTERVLLNAGVPVKTEISPTLKHAIDQREIARAVDFLKSL